MRTPRGSILAASLVLVGCLGVHAAPTLGRSALAVDAGAFTVERPTLLSLGFEWRIRGDENRNAAVKVSFRKKGERAWREALPLLRLGGEPVRGSPARGNGSDDHYFEYVSPNMFAGSILTLEPDTEYECRFVLSDPDGVSGSKERRATVRTRRRPEPAAGGRVFHVYPAGYDGPRQQPAFTGLLAAYYMGTNESDHANVFPPRVRAGDTILVHAGLYKDNRLQYGGFDRSNPGYGTLFDGTYYLTVSGTPEQPIVIKGAGDGEAIFDGDGNHNLFNLLAANYNYFEGITVRNTNVAFLVGLKNIAGASGFTLIRSRLVDVGRGVQEEWAGSNDFYISDNVFIGRHDRTRLQSWRRPDVWGKFPGYPVSVASEYAVKIYGRGHVIANNYISGWHDGVDVATYGTPSEDARLAPSSIDIYANDITVVADNCVEADGAAQNVRVFRNRCFNSTGGAFSAQPVFGGPAYFFQNLVYNATTGGALKFGDAPAGVLVYQNTLFGESALLGPAANLHFRNNLMIAEGWGDSVFDFATPTNYSSADHDGLRSNPEGHYAFAWSAPAARPVDFKGPLQRRQFSSFAAFQQGTGLEQHGVQVDLDVFEQVSLPERSDPQRIYRPDQFDFTLRPASVAIDRGVVLPTINDGYTGAAPDLGAYEAGMPVPLYGPRTWPTGSESDRIAGGEPTHD